MGITFNEAKEAIDLATTVYTTSGLGVTLVEVGYDFADIAYGAYLVADPDDGETIRETSDLEFLHKRPQISANVPANPCNCEHTNHFDDEYGLRTFGAHVYLDVPAGSRKALYVGAICAWCADHCMADYLI